MLDGKTNSRTISSVHFSLEHLVSPSLRFSSSPQLDWEPSGALLYDAPLPLLRACRLMLAPCLSNEDHTEEILNVCLKKKKRLILCLRD